MQIEYDDNGAPRVASYDRGDLVLLQSHETGEMPMGRAGDWGAVTAVSAGGAHVDIRIAGHSNSRSATVLALTDIPIRIICPCDTSGRKLALQHRTQTKMGTWRDRGHTSWKKNTGTR
jgi:hypothetical protein